MKSRIANAIEHFAGANDKDELRRCLEEDPACFQRCAMEMLAGADGRPGFRYLVYLLLNSGLLARALFDGDNLTLSDAVALARNAARTGALLGTEFHDLLKADLLARDTRSAQRLVRILEVLAAVSWTETFVPHRDEFLAYPDNSVRSKAALVIAQTTKDPGWVMRLLMQQDVRVQANAVQGLWGLREEGCREVFLRAAQAPNNRVAGNGLLGLYRLGEVDSVPRVLRMAEANNEAQRRTALWVINETQDPRFIPFLMKSHKSASPAERFWIVRALARIRRRRRQFVEAGQIDISIRAVDGVGPKTAPAENEQALSLSLFGGAGVDLAGLPPLQFALFAGDELVTDYLVESSTNPAQMVIGFVRPRILVGSEPYAEAILAALTNCLAARRAPDLWRIERYSLDRSATGASSRTAEQQPAEAESGVAPKQHRGFLTNTDTLRGIIPGPGPREGVAKDVAAAIDAVIESSAYIAGERHLFVFFDADSADDMPQPVIAKLIENALSAKVLIHAFAPPSDHGVSAAERIVKGVPGSTLEVVSPEAMPSVAAGRYRALLNRYEVRCKTSAANQITLQVWCDRGFGEITSASDGSLEKAA